MLQEKLQRLHQNLGELEVLYTDYSLESITADRKLEWALRYGLLECIQLVIDVSCHIVSKDGLGYPETYSECIKLLHQHGYIPNELKKPLISMVGLRNILIHEYVDIDMEELYECLGQLDDFRQFIRAIQGKMKNN